MIPNTDFYISVNSEIDCCKRQQGIEVSLEGLQHLPTHPPPETWNHRSQTFSLAAVFRDAYSEGVYGQQLVSFFHHCFKFWT